MYIFFVNDISFLSFQDVSIYVSVQTLAATSVERWSAICHPLTFQEKTPRRAIAIILCIWLVSMCAAAPNMVSLTLHWEFRPELTDWLVSCSPGWSSSNELRYQIVKMIVFYVIPVCFMGVTYTRIAICLWESTKQADVLTGKFSLPLLSLEISKQTLMNHFIHDAKNDRIYECDV